ncbi:pur operon repressor [Bacillus marinisedimentorum]|uniref:pur operon repressor n=1 Tax=Bacillus marinisedimentorum TaxID=1821260 RepID=UPI000872D96B|nr:pur operon repressor [Bacillus marinisedimentorum]
MKTKRSGRLVDMTRYLLENPHTLVPLTYFAERYNAAKSSISEDLTIVKSVFEEQGTGKLNTTAGAAGGVMFVPSVSPGEAKATIAELVDRIADPARLLPGGYLYLTDILGHPRTVNEIGRLFAAVFADRKIDVVMTVATKGIPLAYAVADHMNVPVVIVRRDSKVTEGSTVSINYVSGSTGRIQTMVLAKRSLKNGSRVLIIDDFMKAGGTINGMVNLLQEFEAEVAGIGVLVEAEDVVERLVDEYISLVQLAGVDVKQQKINAEEGNYFRFLESAIQEGKGDEV